MDTLAADLRHAARSLLRHPGLALTALATLAVGIGASTAIFSIVYGVLLRPLPYAEPDRLVRVSERHPGATSPLTGAYLSNLTWHAWAHAKTVEHIAAFSGETYTVRVDRTTMRVGGAAVSPALFNTLRVRPALGRFFLESEATRDQHPVVLGHSLWQTQFGGRANVLGTALVLDGTPHTIVGVAPPGFAFPATDAQLWVPYVMRPATRGAEANVNVFQAIARLRGAATTAQAAAEGTAATRGFPRSIHADLLFGKGGPVEVSVRTMVDELTYEIRPALIVLMTGVVLLLVIACANVANLLLSRGVDRQRELAVRIALGSSRGRLVRLLLVESLLLSLAGGLAGVLFGGLLIGVAPGLAPADFPRLDAISLDLRVLAFAAATSLLAGLVAGLFPAWRSTRNALAIAIRDDDPRTAAGSRAGRSVLLAAEAALAVVLLVGASLLGRSFVNLVAVDSGFDPNNVLSARLYQTDADRTPARTQQLLDTLIARLRAMPGVVEAAAGNMAPFADSTYIAGFRVPGVDADGQPLMARALAYVVTPGYVRATGLTVKSGRGFTDADTHSATRAVLLNEGFVRAFFRDGKPAVGRRWSAGRSTISEVVGVVADVRRHGPLSLPQPEMYIVANEQETVRREIYVVIRTSGDPLALAGGLRALVGELDSTAALDSVQTLRQQVSASISQPRFVMTTLVTFAGLALTLAAIGLYGALSYSVAQRRRELGVRAALGASERSLISLVLGQGLRTTAIGLVAGLIAAAVLSRLMSRLLYGVEPLDATSFAVAPVILLLVAIAACVVPARRAAAVDPAHALRGE